MEAIRYPHPSVDDVSIPSHAHSVSCGFRGNEVDQPPAAGSIAAQRLPVPMSRFISLLDEAMKPKRTT